MKILFSIALLLFTLSSLGQPDVPPEKDKYFQSLIKKATKGKCGDVSSLDNYIQWALYKEPAIAALKVASEKGCVLAGRLLGDRLYKRSRDSAILYFTQCAEANDKSFSGTCAFNLGWIYLKGIPMSSYADPVPERDLVKAKFWIKKAIALGYHDTGYGDPDVALDYVENALLKHYDDGLAAYKDGNYMEAFRLWKDASYSQKDISAMNGLAWLFLQGWGVKKDAYESGWWYGRVGDAGDATGYVRAGKSFLQVDDGDYVRAIEMFEKAKSKGVEEAVPLLADAKAKLQGRVNAVMASRAAATGSSPQRNNNQTYTNPTTAERRKTCPICNGTGKRTDRSTSEKRDWNNKTITMTDHVTTSNCIRCNGSGYITY